MTHGKASQHFSTQGGARVEFAAGPRRLPGRLLLLGSLASLAGCRDGGDNPEHGPGSPAPTGLPELALLEAAPDFEESLEDLEGRNLLAEAAFARLTRRKDAARLFASLLGSKNSVARLHGLKGTWIVDRDAYAASAVELVASKPVVPTTLSCIVRDEPVANLVHGAGESDPARRFSAAALLSRGKWWLAAADPGDEGICVWLARLTAPDMESAGNEAGELAPRWHRAARVLAWGLDGAGLDALLGRLPSLAPERRAAVLGTLRRVPPWSRGALDAIAQTLRRNDGWAHRGAAMALRSLASMGPLRTESARLIPLIDHVLRTCPPPRDQGVLAEAEGEEHQLHLCTTLQLLGPEARPTVEKLARDLPALARHLELPAPRDR